MAVSPSRDQTTQVASNIPIPDPTEITAREIVKVKEELRNEFLARFDGIKEIIETRLAGMDKTHVLLQEEVLRVEKDTKAVIVSMGTLFDEKLNGILTRFDGIAVQFRERDIRTDQDKIAASTAVNAALQAQKEAAGAQNESNAAAITKSETSFTKEIDGLKQLINATKDTFQSQISNLTGRLDRGEGGSTGQRQEVQDRRASIGTIVGVAGGILGALGLMWGVMQSIQTKTAVIPPAYYSPVQPPAKP